MHLFSFIFWTFTHNTIQHFEINLNLITIANSYHIYIYMAWNQGGRSEKLRIIKEQVWGSFRLSLGLFRFHWLFPGSFVSKPWLTYIIFYNYIFNISCNLLPSWVFIIKFHQKSRIFVFNRIELVLIDTFGLTKLHFTFWIHQYELPCWSVICYFSILK